MVLEFLAWLVRWLEFAGVLILAGTAIFRISVGAPLQGEPRISAGESRLLDEAAHRFDRSLYGLALLLLTLVTPPDLLFRAIRLTERPVGEIFPILPAILRETHAGGMWLIKLGALIFGWICLIVSVIIPMTGGPRRIVKWGMPAAALLWLVAVSLSGHAADEEGFSRAMLADIVHVTAAGAWIGGLVPLIFSVRLVWHQLSRETADIIVVRILKRFSTVATASVGGILLSGMYMAWHRLPDAPSLPGNAYGYTLVLKLGLVAVIMSLGGLNKWYLLPRLENQIFQEGQPTERHLKQQILRFLALEAVLAAAVLGCAALLAQSSADM